MKKINLSGLKKVLSPKEMKNVLGGSIVGEITGGRCWQGQCYCDITYNDGTTACEVPCGMHVCEILGIAC